MQIINIHNAQTNFFKYLKMVTSGEEVIICSANKPVARLISYKANSKPRVPGKLKGKIKIAKDFDKLPKAFLRFLN